MNALNSQSGRLTSAIVVVFFALLLTAIGCDRKKDSAEKDQSASTSDGADSAPADPNVVELLFSYGSEKEKWINDVTKDFNSQKVKTAGGKTIHVTPKPLGSGESMEDILSGKTHAHLWSPASEVFVKLANARSAAKGGPLIGKSQNLVLSPVVIAMWKPMAVALGWPEKPIGWAEVIRLAKDPRGWASYGHAEFGEFKFGHTHPEYSNSGLISILAETYAGAGKVRGLAPSDLEDPKVGQYLDEIEQSVVHYGRSTGFFGRQLAKDGPQYLSAAVLYENMVVESYANPGAIPLVAIYPKEGTFWSDHPVGVVEREWVDDEHRAAANTYIDFLRAGPQQLKALTYGFRPAEGNVAAPIDAAHGVDPHQPNTVLETPSADTITRVLQLWRAHKKPASVIVVFDRSGSMVDENKITYAREGAVKLLDMLDDRDAFGLVPFSSHVEVVPAVPLSTGRQQMRDRINAIFPGGETNLYEAIATAHDLLTNPPQPKRICAVVVLTDGEDNGTRVTLDQLLSKLRASGERSDVRVFTIGYGSSAQLDALKKISEQTRGEFYQGTTENIQSKFKEIATFF